MNRTEAIETIVATIDTKDAIVSTTGLISRELFEKFDSERNIYVPGSMGLSSSIGLGIALSSEKKRVIVIDGDASLLMNLGSMVTIGYNRPKNLLHIVLDNGSYGSCSEEKSMSHSANLLKLADTVGYRYARNANSQRQLECAILMFEFGPGFILATIELGGRRNLRRPMELAMIKNRFMRFLKH
jgi:thiamine pyrophosphate-dependent acetolactate synthase large subunit-like protein